MDQPAGTITFLFTDIEGSTPLWDLDPGTMDAALASHDRLLREAIEQQGGFVFKTVGDAFYAAFSRVDAAALAAIHAQLALGAHRWQTPAPLRVRMAIHTGMAEVRDGDYFGPPLNRVARILASGHGGQVLVSQVSARLLAERPSRDASLIDLGEQSLRGLSLPERVYQVQHPGLQRDFPLLRSQTPTPTSLPHFPTAFVGREALLLQVVEFLRTRSARLVTLTGPGGSGKTRLGVAAATELQDAFPGGVHFVPLAPISDATLVPSAIAQVLGVREPGDGRPLAAALATYLRERRLLLVLDNFEHLPSAAGSVSELLEAPSLTILATSRMPLHLYGEQEVPVPPLSLPAETSSQGFDELAENEAVALFVARARAAQPAFALTESNLATVAGICRRLDGLPLAIELAAPRIKLLSPEGLLNRLDHRLDVLTWGARDADERQRTLRATIDWSHGLLDERERTLFRRLGVFRGGFTLEGAEGVCADVQCPHAEILEVLSSLADKSLVQRQAAGLPVERLGLLETIRDYALERLDESGEADVVRRAHARYYAGMAADVAPGLHRAAQAESLRCLELEHDNLRAALEWLAGHDGSRLAGMAMALWPFWQAHGDNSEGRDWLSRALEIAGSGAPPAVRAGLLYGMGFLSWSQGDDAASRHELGAAVRLFEEAGDSHGRSRAQVHLGIALWMAGVPPAECLADLEQAIAVLREFDDTESLADGLHYLGHVVFEQGDLEKARSLWDESSALSRRQGDRWGLALSVKDLGLVAARNGDLATARRLYAESLAILRETHEKWHIADALNRLGEIAVSEQSLGEARACFEEALALAREVDNQSGVVETINRIAELHLVDGDLAEARRLYEQCLELSTQIANQRLTAAMQHNLGNVALREGQLALAGRHFRDSLYIYAELGRDAGLAMAVDGVAAVAALSGNFEVAARAFGLAAAARERAGAQFDRIEHEIDVSGIVRHVEEQMGEEPFGAALAAGRRMEVASLLGRAIEASEWP